MVEMVFSVAVGSKTRETRSRVADYVTQSIKRASPL